MKKLFLRILLAVFGLVIGVAILFLPYHRSEMTTEHVQALVHSALPQGASRADVERFLQKNRIGYSSGARIVNASIPGTSKSLLIEGSIFIVFSFDANGRLVDTKVDEVFTGP